MNFKNIFRSLKNKDMLKRLGIILGIIVLYRFLAHIPVPMGEPKTFQEAVLYLSPLLLRNQFTSVKLLL